MNLILLDSVGLLIILSISFDELCLLDVSSELISLGVVKLFIFIISNHINVVLWVSDFPLKPIKHAPLVLLDITISYNSQELVHNEIVTYPDPEVQHKWAHDDLDGG